MRTLSNPVMIAQEPPLVPQNSMGEREGIQVTQVTALWRAVWKSMAPVAASQTINLPSSSPLTSISPFAENARQLIAPVCPMPRVSGFVYLVQSTSAMELLLWMSWDESSELGGCIRPGRSRRLPRVDIHVQHGSPHGTETS